MLIAIFCTLLLLLPSVILYDGWVEVAPLRNISFKAANEFYLLSSFKATWYDALIFCKYYYMEIATPETPLQNDRLLTFLKTHDAPTDHWYYIGGTNLGQPLENHFWILTGNLVANKSFWVPNTPKRYPGCLLFDTAHQGWMYNDTWCWKKQGFICQTKAATGKLY